MKMDIAVFATVFTSMTALFTAFIALLQFRASKVQENRSFESIYLNRLWSILDSLKDSDDSQHKNIYYEYIMFCCDQIELRELSRITDNTWKFWSRDMREFILEKESDKDFQDALDNFSNTKTQKYKYYTNMMDKSNDRKFDPLLSPIRPEIANKRHKYIIFRWFSGL